MTRNIFEDEKKIMKNITYFRINVIIDQQF